MPCGHPDAGLPEDYVPPYDRMVTLADGREFPMKKTICIPHGNNHVPAGPRVKLTAKLREQEERKEELLRTAAQNGAELNARELLDEGVDPNCRAQCAGATPLICASIKGHHKLMQMLLDAGADPNLGNGNMDTPLSVSSYWGRTDCVKLLLDHGVDPRQHNNAPAPLTPIGQAMQNDFKDIAEMLAKRWQELEAKDQKKEEKRQKAEELKTNKHRAQVSADAQAARGPDAAEKRRLLAMGKA